MNLKKILLIAVVLFAIIILAGAAFMGMIVFDVMSGFATGYDTLTPAGNETGHALVVYNPAILGAAKGTATTIADDLQARGYRVTLAGVRSPAAAATGGYDVIVVGGPIYAGNQSSSIKSYMKTLTVPAGVKLGMFATGSDKDILKDPIKLRNEVTSLPDGSTLTVKAVVKVVSDDDKAARCQAFVDELLS